MHRSLFALAVFFGVTAGAFAQTTSTTILGTVSDPSGAVVAGAKISAINKGTGVKREDVTSTTGDYSFPLLDVGTYDVVVSISGFKTETQRNVELTINQKARVNFTLVVGAQADRVEITAEAAMLKTDEASLGSVVEQRRVVELPLNGRNLAGVAVLQPGIQFGSRMGFDGLSGYGGGVQCLAYLFPLAPTDSATPICMLLSTAW